jgi:hypothetical protein
MSQMVVVTMKRKMLLRMSGVEMKDGVDAYFFRACKSECNGYAQPQVDSMTLRVYNCIGL